MIYLNQSSTTYPKPDVVRNAYIKAFDSIPFGENRNNINLGFEDPFTQCRENLGKLFCIENTDDIYFSSSATDSFNLLLNILDLSTGNVIITSTEHNSLVRPLYNLNNITKDIRVIACDQFGKIDPISIEKQLDENTKAIFVNHCSNVTGCIQDLRAIGNIAKKHGILFVVDASQSGGCIAIDVENSNIDVLIFTGHKGLFGVQGTGGYYLKNSQNYRPFRYGGTGKEGKKFYYNSNDKKEFEVGTQNYHGICALNAGVKFILDTGVNKIFQIESNLVNILIEGLKKLNKVIVYINPLDSFRGPTVSFNIKGFSSFDVGYILENSYNIIIRSGYHCAPFIHKYLNTEEFGTVRISVSIFNNEEEIYSLLSAIEDISTVK